LLYTQALAAEGDEGVDIRISQMLIMTKDFSVKDMVLAIRKVSDDLKKRRAVIKGRCRQDFIDDVSRATIKETGSDQHFFNKEYLVRA
jgi:hypothetical protein